MERKNKTSSTNDNERAIQSAILETHELTLINLQKDITSLKTSLDSLTTQTRSRAIDTHRCYKAVHYYRTGRPDDTIILSQEFQAGLPEYEAREENGRDGKYNEDQYDEGSPGHNDDYQEDKRSSPHNPRNRKLPSSALEDLFSLIQGRSGPIHEIYRNLRRFIETHFDLNEIPEEIDLVEPRGNPNYFNDNTERTIGFDGEIPGVNGTWEFISSGEGSAEQLAALNFGGQPEGVPHKDHPTAQDIMDLRVYQFRNGLPDTTADIELVWVPSSRNHLAHHTDFLQTNETALNSQTAKGISKETSAAEVTPSQKTSQPSTNSAKSNKTKQQSVLEQQQTALNSLEETAVTRNPHQTDPAPGKQQTSETNQPEVRRSLRQASKALNFQQNTSRESKGAKPKKTTKAPAPPVDTKEEVQPPLEDYQSDGEENATADREESIHMYETDRAENAIREFLSSNNSSKTSHVIKPSSHISKEREDLQKSRNESRVDEQNINDNTKPMSKKRSHSATRSNASESDEIVVADKRPKIPDNENVFEEQYDSPEVSRVQVRSSKEQQQQPV